MLFGTVLGLVICRSNPQEVTTQFFNGMGNAYGNVIGIIIAVAGAAIVCAQLAGVDPMEIAKRNAPGMIIAAVVAMFILL